MTHLRKLTAVLLAVIMVFALAACGQKDDTAAVDIVTTVTDVTPNFATVCGKAVNIAERKATRTSQY